MSDGPHEVEQGVGAVVSIASDFKNALPDDEIQDVFGVVLSQSERSSCLGATAMSSEATKGRHASSGGRVLFEFCCDEESNLGKVGEEVGVQVIRLCKESIDLSDDQAIDQLCEQVKALPGCSLHRSIECRPWSAWQRLNMKKHPRLCEKINKDREESLLMIARFIKVAEIILDQGGHVSFEWPRYCAGWIEEPLASWISSRQLYSSCFPGCAVGVTAADDEPAAKPWRFVTSSMQLAQNLAALKCTHSKHAPLQGKWTRMSAFYPRPLCHVMMSSLFPHVVNRHVFSMPCVARSYQPHRPKLVRGYPSIPLDVMMFETGCHEVHTPAFVHKLLDRSEWKGHPEALKAIENERQGLLANGTRDESKIRSKSEILAEARAAGKKIHIGSLMIIVSIKGYERPTSEWAVKARVVFRGDIVKDEANQAAVFDEVAASSPSSLSGLNAIIAFGLLDGHQTTTSDCIKAYIQSPLSSSQQTFVQLPYELLPPHSRQVAEPCAPLVRSLYGHPLASASWQNYLARILSEEFQGYAMDQLPSCYFFPKLQLALSVDDLTLSGPVANHTTFWTTLRKRVQLEDPAPLSKVLGRGHFQHGDGLALHSADFAKQCVSLFEELSGKAVKLYRTPHVDEGSLISTDEADRGQLSNVAAKLVMKFMWLGRISRPDLLVAINTCAGHITKRTSNDDKRMTRLAGYVVVPLSCHACERSAFSVAFVIVCRC